MRTLRCFVSCSLAVLLMGCGETNVEDPGPPGGNFTVVDAAGSHAYVAAEEGVVCSIGEALDGTPALSVRFTSLEDEPAASLNLFAAPYRGKASTYYGEFFGSQELEPPCSGGPCWGVWWHPTSEKMHASTFDTRDCVLEVTPHEDGVAGEFACGQLEPEALAIEDGRFYCVQVESSP